MPPRKKTQRPPIASERDRALGHRDRQLDNATTNYSLRGLIATLIVFSVVTLGAASLQNWNEKHRLTYVSLVGTWGVVAFGHLFLLLIMRRRKQSKYGAMYIRLGAFATSKSWQHAALFLAMFVFCASTIFCVIYVNAAEDWALSPHWAILTFAYAIVSLAAILQSYALFCVLAAPGVVELYEQTIAIQGRVVEYDNVQETKWSASQDHVLIIATQTNSKQMTSSVRVPPTLVQAVDDVLSAVLGKKHSAAKSELP